MNIREVTRNYNKLLTETQDLLNRMNDLKLKSDELLNNLKLQIERSGTMITWKQGNSGEIIVFLFGKFYCTCDNWREFKEVEKELLMV